MKPRIRRHICCLGHGKNVCSCCQPPCSDKLNWSKQTSSSNESQAGTLKKPEVEKVSLHGQKGSGFGLSAMFPNYQRSKQTSASNESQAGIK
jgi:hypothetical protein